MKYEISVGWVRYEMHYDEVQGDYFGHRTALYKRCNWVRIYNDYSKKQKQNACNTMCMAIQDCLTISDNR